MTCLEWSRKLGELREGKLRLQAPEENGLSREAGQSIYDLQEYVKALEHGYRAVCTALDGYRRQERVRGGLFVGGKTVKELLDNQWSEGACLGYAIMAMRQAGFRDREIECVLDAAREIMQVASVEDAAGGYEVWCTGREDGQCSEQGRPAGDGDGGLSQPALRRTEAAASGGPEWIGPSAEMKSEVQG